jgi:adenosyl cobinamide kinase/adenosyl cobinamide phosphate guanylyltransferase
VITLVLGGARSGKSVVAERIFAGLPAPRTYVATAVVEPGDADMAERVAAHRERRPASWALREVGGDLAPALRDVTGSVLVDALGTWVASTPGLDPDVDDLVDALRGRTGDTVLVSDEVGLGVHPSSEAGRHFRDALGLVNIAVAEVADRVLLVVAGRVLPLEEGPA